MLAAMPAHADSVTTSAQGGYGRILFTLDAGAHSRASIADGVAVISFDRKVTIDPNAAVQDLSAFAGGARLDADGKTLRIALSQNAHLHTSASGARFAVDLVPGGVATPPDLPPPPPKEATAVDISKLPALAIRAGAYSNFTRLVFDWPKNIPYTVFPGAGRLTVRFEAQARPDLSALEHVSPPWVKNTGWKVENHGLVLEFETDTASGYHDFRDGNHVVLDIIAPKTDTATYQPPGIAHPKPVKLAANVSAAQVQAVADTAAKLKPDDTSKPDTKPVTPATPLKPPVTAAITPAPPTTPPQQTATAAPAAPAPPAAAPIQTADAQRTAKGVTLTFPGAVSAAVFTRGLTAWIVLDGKQAIDLVKLKTALGDFPSSFDAANGDASSVLRIGLRIPAKIAAHGAAGKLIVTIGTAPASAPMAIGFSPETTGGKQTLAALLPGAGHVMSLADPGVGDTLTVVTAAPGRAVLEPRSYAEFALLPTAEGVAVKSLADDLVVQSAQSKVTIGRPQGLMISPPAVLPITSVAQLAQSGEGPSFIAFAAWKSMAGGDFYTAQRRLMGNIAKVSPADANRGRITLARFYLANGFAAEALGLIDVVQKSDPTLTGDVALQTMRAAADTMMARYKDGHNAIATEAFDADQHAALWRGLTDAGLGNWDAARKELDTADSVLRHYPAEWQARARIAEADASIATGALEHADAALSHLPRDLSPQLALQAQLSRARLYAQEGRTRNASALFTALESSGDEALAAQAIYARVDAGLTSGAMTRKEAIDALEGLRFRWRGDDLELKTLRKLGALYFADRRWREGLESLRVATRNFGDADLARQAEDDQREAFAALFLKGKADKLPPVEALALFYDFIDLTPIGPDGDEMIRRMADRLAAVDLLEPAAKLLDYQVNKRLDGVARSQVAARLAMIDLLDHKPKDALETLRATQMSGLPDDLTHQRTLLQARALAALKQWDQALDMIATDEQPDSRRLRADIYWESANWAVAGQKSEELVAARFTGTTPLTAAERQDVMRASIAYSLAGDQPSLDRLREHFAAKMKTSPDASAFAVVTASIDTQGTAFRDLAGKIAAIDTLETFMQDFKKRYELAPKT
jgi:tetratricopeptide (TPR) repeat protein